ncbi:hypothetical protein ACFQMJ_24140 [Cohnella cellulosilytica]|uniref:DUF559 domain-containing protein n=1 Tax=Cohnella cellulosilytica TaxID=986710 RepID=A0ABW2FEP2_9BACL
MRGLSFEAEHEKWMDWHLDKRHGERKDALRRGHGYGNRLFVEKIWWSLMGHFGGLHPEYEVKDWRGRSYYADFVWIVGAHRFVFEIMDYGSHGKDRTKYRMDLNRVLFLQSQGYVVFLISLDELKENSPFILSMLRHSLAPYLTAAAQEPQPKPTFGKIERQLMRHALLHDRIVRPAAAAKELELHKHTVIKHCRNLVEKGRLRAIPTGSTGKIYCYEYMGTAQSPDLL